MVILNLTQHKATPEQVKAGVIDLPQEYKAKLVEYLTFNDIPNKEELKKRADNIYNLVIDFCLDNSPIKDEVEDMLYEDWQKLRDEGSLYIDEKEFKKIKLGFMIGGAPFFMSYLEEELSHIGTPMYAFSKREVIEKEDEDGVVSKTAIFKHIGFVEV